MALYPRGKSAVYDVTGVASIPAATAYAGTLTTDSNDATIINGSGTDFSFITPNDWWILDLTHGEIREITVNFAIPLSGTQIQQLKIASAFTNPLATTACLLVPSKTIASINIQNVGAGTAKINGVDFKNGIDTFELKNDYGLQPIVVDGTASTLLVTLLYS